MTDFIDRKSLIMDILSAGKIGKLSCIDIIKRAKTADVQPVVHGKWLRSSEDGKRKCSICRMYECERNYCANCGAKMDL